MGFNKLITISGLLVMLALCGPAKVYADGQDIPWGYDDQSKLPAVKWQESFPNCAGQRQSPIALDSIAATPDSDLQPLVFTGYENQPAGNVWIAKNNGHTFELSGTDWSSSGVPTLTGGSLPGTYEFWQMHFHWGSNSDQGSEHTLDGRAYPLEVHLVHKRVGSADPTSDPVGLAVVGIFFDLPSDSHAQFPPGLNQMIGAVAQMASQAGQPMNITLPDFVLEMLLPQSLDYFRYLGSLTTPGCNEAVVWTVLKDKLQISEDFLTTFRELRDADGAPIQDNFRPVQNLEDRVVSMVPSE